MRTHSQTPSPIASRFIYAFSQGYIYRRKLADIREHQAVVRVMDLDPRAFSALEVELLILDFDGVLAAHGNSRPDQAIESWLDECLSILGTGRVFVLSNRGSPQRDVFLRTRFPRLGMSTSARKKPFPDGIKAILRMTGVSAEHTLMVDDRLLTGCLAGCVAGTQVRYVARASRDFGHRPFTETWFALLRLFERTVITLTAWRF